MKSLITILFIFIFGAIDIILFLELVNVLILGDLEAYPWGLINNNPWFYANSDLYKYILFVKFIILTTLLSLVIRAMLKKDHKRKSLFFFLCSVFVIIIIISSKIQ